MKNLVNKYGHIKVNLPSTLNDYHNGNGEGMFAVVTNPEDKAKYDADCTSGLFIAILDNDSIYYPHLNAGTPVVCEYRGKNRPTACWNLLGNNKEAEKNRQEVLKQLGVGTHTGYDLDL